MIREGSAWGKLILGGEHAVVFGWPGLAMAVDRLTHVRLEPFEGPTHAAGVTDPRLGPGLAAALGATGWRVHIDSTVPMGAGMGSSAAIAVAAARALLGPHAPREQVFACAMAAERVFHGNPSGIDQTVSDRGGLVRFARRPDKLEVTDLPAPAWRFVVLDTGRAGSTRDLVAAVAARRPAIDPLLNRIGALVDEEVAALGDRRAFGALMDENQALLRQIGVSTPEIDDLVERARRAGALGAKLAGAGGGGVVVALADDPAPVLAAVPGRAFEVRIAPRREGP